MPNTPKLPAATPDVTKTQVTAIIQGIIAVAVALGVHMSTQTQTTLLATSGALAGLLILGDALIRKGRAGALAQLANPDLVKALYESVRDTAESIDPQLVKDLAAKIDELDAVVSKLISGKDTPASAAVAGLNPGAGQMTGSTDPQH